MTTQRRTERLALLSKAEKNLIAQAKDRSKLQQEKEELLKGAVTPASTKRLQEVNKELYQLSTKLGTLVRRLDERLDALFEDLNLILKEESLKPLMAIQAEKFHEIDATWNPFTTMPVGNSYAGWKVREITSRIESTNSEIESMKRKSYYWLDIAKPEPTVDNIFEPEYSIKGIKSKEWTKVISENGTEHYESINVRDILIKAVRIEREKYDVIQTHPDLQILPKNIDSSRDIYEIIEAIKNFEIKFAKLGPLEKQGLEVTKLDANELRDVDGKS
jgi:hypothetical protein